MMPSLLSGKYFRSQLDPVKHLRCSFLWWEFTATFSLFYLFDWKSADLMFFPFYKAKCARPKIFACHRGFARPGLPKSYESYLTSLLVIWNMFYFNSSQCGKRWKQNTKLWCRFVFANLNLSWSRGTLNSIISIYLFSSSYYYYFTFYIPQRIRIKVCSKEAWLDDVISHKNSDSKRKLKLLRSSIKL